MSADIEQPVAEDPAAPAAVADEAAPEAVETAERDVDADTLEIPDHTQDGGKARYVPASALAGARAELKTIKADLETAKAGSAKASQLEQQIAQLQGQIQQLTPYVQAYQAAVQTQTQPAEDDTEAVELAKDMDLYLADGQPDVTKAKRILARIDKRSKAQVDEGVAPIHQMTTQQRSNYNLQRALNTVIQGETIDPTVLKAAWGRVNMNVTADEEQAKHLVMWAYGAAKAEGKTKAVKAATTTGTPKADLPDPIFSEKAGGKDTPNDLTMNEVEKKAAKDMGLSEKEYLESARSAPWLRR